MTLVTIPSAGLPQGARRRTARDANRQVNAAGVMLRAPSGKVLFLKRSDKEKNFAGHWALPGGGVDAGETHNDAARRECLEETGFRCGNLKPHHKGANGFVTFLSKVASEFEPRINEEHSTWRWAHIDDAPRPLHPGVKAMLDTKKHDSDYLDGGEEQDALKKIKGAGDAYIEKKTQIVPFPQELWPERKKRLAATEDYTNKYYPNVNTLTEQRKNFPRQNVPLNRVVAIQQTVDPIRVKQYKEALTRRGPGVPPIARKYQGKYYLNDGHHRATAAHELGYTHLPMHVDDYDAHQSRQATDEAPFAFDRLPFAFALDRGPSVRAKDQDGHLHVKVTPISKATVNPYLGREIPYWEELGLSAEKIYKLLRDPKELAKAAHTFGGKPLLIVHKPLNSNEHPSEKVIGAVGTSPKFDGTYIQAPLTVWTQQAINLIESGKQKELSSGYRYRADMTPGVYKGMKYDGVMRDILGNHVAVVVTGRAGSDVVVEDSSDNLIWSMIENVIREL
jgi:8-oxo-dGTP pyrophosphatase MutT (NUDIX family)